MSTQFDDVLTRAKGLPPAEQAKLLVELGALVRKNGEPSSTVKPIETARDLAADFWPEDETVDELIDTIRVLRDQGAPRMMD